MLNCVDLIWITEWSEAVAVNCCFYMVALLSPLSVLVAFVQTGGELSGLDATSSRDVQVDKIAWFTVL